MRNRFEAGISLVEILIASVILSVLIVVTLSFMSWMTDSADFENQVLTLEQDSNRVLEELANSLRSAQVTAGHSADAGIAGLLGTNDLGSAAYATEAGQICFQVPVDWDDDGDISGDFDNTNSVMYTDWGAKREDMLPSDFHNAYMIYRFVTASTYDEAMRKVDLNADGDFSDKFDIGHLETIYTAGGSHAGVNPPEVGSVTVNMLSGNAIVRAQNLQVGDIDGDGVNDPIFTLRRAGENTTVLTITLFTARPDEKRPILVTSSTAIELRNEQP